MKLKYYLRGMGIGIILTAIVMGFALGGRKATLSDAEIIKRAKALGMVEADSGVLSQTVGEVTKEDENDTSASGETLDKEGKEISEEIQQEVALSGASASEVAKAEEIGDDNAGESPSSDESKKSDESSVESSKGKDEAVSEISTSEAVSEVSTGATTDIASEAKSTESTAAASAASTQEVTAAAAQATSTASAQTTASTATGASKTITIPGGLGSDQVAAILAREGVIDNAVSFNRYLIDRGQDRIIRSGTKTIPAGATYEQIANIITKG